MKKMLLTILLSLIVILSFAPNDHRQPNLFREFLQQQRELKHTEIKMKTLTAIIKTEKPHTIQQARKAYLRENAVGILQIRPIMVRACNQIAGYNKYTLKDRNDSIKSVEMFFLFQDRHNLEYNFERACYLWNGGEGYERQSLHYRIDVFKYWVKARKNV